MSKAEAHELIIGNKNKDLAEHQIKLGQKLKQVIGRKKNMEEEETREVANKVGSKQGQGHKTGSQ